MKPTKEKWWVFSFLSFMVNVAQLVRVPDCESGGCGFEAHHSPQV